MESSFLYRVYPAILALGSLCFVVPLGSAQNSPPAKIDVMVVPDITIQTEDYAEARKTFHTKLLRKASAPHQEDCKNSKPPIGAPHDLRRTCARLCRLAGGELDQIQFLLGHVSIQTTERYLGCKQKLRSAVNDLIGIEPHETKSAVEGTGQR